MIHFLIPIKSARTTNDWGSVQKAFSQTLCSVYNQTSDAFNILIAHHEKPNVEGEFDHRVEFITVEHESPTRESHVRLKMMDKGKKIQRMANRVRELGGGYCMIVDADDLVSNRIAQFTEDHPNENGWFVQRGFMYDGTTDRYRIQKDFHRVCGTSAIVNYDVDELPTDNEYLEDPFVDPKSRFGRFHVRSPHSVIASARKSIGKPLAPLPFEGAVYRRNITDSNSTNQITFFRKYDLLFRWGSLSRERLMEFSVPKT